MYSATKAVLMDARDSLYGIMAMNCCNIEMVRGAIRAANDLRAPLILQISPKQMRRHAHAEEMVPLIRNMAEQVGVPVCLNYDHGTDIDEIAKALKAGFSSVMIDGSKLPFEENARRTKTACVLAHSAGVSVEAELGHVGMAANADELKADYLTDPESARQFVELTGVDSLAVAIGTAHGAYPKGESPVLDFVRLEKIRNAVSVPLVLHGGSGSGEKNLKEAVSRGISKINFATDAFETARRGFLGAYEKDPSADYLALSAAAEQAIYDFVSVYLPVIGSAGRFVF